MTAVNIHEAKTHLSRLVDQAVAGEEVIISKAGRPLVRLVPVGAAGGRRLGLLAGRIRVPEDFNAPLPPDLLSRFEGST
jgi:prevent-host-death family protein